MPRWLALPRPGDVDASLMKAVVVKALGGPECLQIAEVEMPLPAAGEVTVKLSWAGVNFIDVYIHTRNLPRIPVSCH
jgi:NADPH:quinone reductase-like Zn-dependent oxidoreductase